MVEFIFRVLFPYKETLFDEGIVLRLDIIVNIVFWERRLWEKEEEITTSLL